MIFTLHAYIARELGRVFIMTALCLTLIIVMGGGMANLFRGEGIGATEMGKIFLYLTPVAGTFILPVAALFAATITYGRAAVDNEILACRAAGINVHRLLLSSVWLGFLVAAATYASWNWLLPTLDFRIKQLSRSDLPSIVVGQLKKARTLEFVKYRMKARDCVELPPEELPPDRRAGHRVLVLEGASFMELEDDEPSRYGTADATFIDFDETGPTPCIRVDLRGVRSFDAVRRQYYELQHQILGPYDVAPHLSRKIKFETLGSLLKFRERPQDIPDMQKRLQSMRREMMSYFLNLHVEEQLTGPRAKGVFELQGDGLTYVVTAQRLYKDRSDGHVRLEKARVEERRAQSDRSRLLTADTCNVELSSAQDVDRTVIVLELYGNVTIQPLSARQADRVVNKPSEVLEAVDFDRQAVPHQQVSEFDFARLLDERFVVDLPAKQDKKRAELITRLRGFVSEVNGEIHFRASYAVSVWAMVVIGALLGVILRGGQVLTAFGISCLPTLFVVIACVVGRNLADRPQHAVTSLVVMWSAAAAVYAVTAWLAVRVLPR